MSYGTRLAMTYADLFPDRVRTLVLDGIVPQQDALGVTMGRDAQRALDLLFERCAADPACAAAFPDLSARFTNLLNELATPLEVELSDPFTGLPTTVELSRELAAITVQTLSYAPETSALLPLLISTAAAGDLRPLAAQTLLVQEQLPRRSHLACASV
ncbi:MAG: alpha/beta hydrolase [Oscillochloris sp.]|nr:alpha/beta hydrolase [Oscillochloris sp.]